MKVGLVGTACCGKSTLVEEIKKRDIYKNHTIIEEVAGRIPKAARNNINSQFSILKEQINEEKKYNNFISDRTVIDNYYYFMYYYKDIKCKLSYSGIYNNYHDAFNYHLITKPYDCVFFIDEYFILEDNGIRDLDEDMQSWIYTVMKDGVMTLCDIYNIPCIYVTGDLNKRIEKIQESLESIYDQKRLHDYKGDE